MPTRLPNSFEQNHYAVLSLPPPTDTNSSPPTQHQIKQAYHRALLQHHPDKVIKTPEKSTLGRNGQQPLERVPYTVDDLTLAYRTLSDPNLRLAYDRKFVMEFGSLMLHNGEHAPSSENRPGLEIIDLEDMEFDETARQFYRSCRCGKEKGYIVSEAQLEECEDDGEITIGCQGCSLWLTVGFAVSVDG